MIKVEVLTKFKRQYKKLPREVREKANARSEIFMANPFDPRLDTHKLHGRDRFFWGFSVSRSCRIKFEFLGKQGAVFVEIGPHDDVYR